MKTKKSRKARAPKPCVSFERPTEEQINLAKWALSCRAPAVRRAAEQTLARALAPKPSNYFWVTTTGATSPSYVTGSVGGMSSLSAQTASDATKTSVYKLAAANSTKTDY